MALSPRLSSSLISCKNTTPTPPYHCLPGRVLQKNHHHLSSVSSSCSCGRRLFLQTTASTAFFPICPSFASKSPSDYLDVLQRVHPPRPDWYEELYASVLNTYMESYEAEIAGYKSQLFDNLVGKAKKVLEIGIGTGPNLKYYAGDTDVQVFGVDPNQKMEKYARAAAANAGLPPANFNFIHAVGEAIPVPDASVDAVVGTLVLCSVKNVNLTLKASSK